MLGYDDLKSMMDFNRARVLDLMDKIEATGKAAEILAWRPGPGRAHIAWQLMHLPATEDRYVNVRLKGGEPVDPDLVAKYAGGSKPDDGEVPTPAAIRETLAAHRERFLAHVRSMSDAELDAIVPNPAPNAPQRTGREWLQVLIFHEAHHQGQAHLTFNLYKAAHGMA